jgi:hypothetical protein
MQHMLLLVACLLVFASSSAFANNYGAMAYDRQSGAVGWSYDHPSQKAANDRALRECLRYGSQCAVVVEFMNLCAAYATGPGTTAGWGRDYTRAAAEQRALKACQSRGAHCQIRVWACSSKPGSSPDWMDEAVRSWCIGKPTGTEAMYGRRCP